MWDGGRFAISLLGNPRFSDPFPVRFPLNTGAGRGNRTPVYCLEGSHFTTKLVPPLVGVPGIEPEPHPPHGCILPLYYTPFGLLRIELRPHAPKAWILPLYYSPPCAHRTAGNRTQGSRTRIVYITTIRQSVLSSSGIYSSIFP